MEFPSNLPYGTGWHDDTIDDEPRVANKVGPHGYVHGWIKADATGSEPSMAKYNKARAAAESASDKAAASGKKEDHEAAAAAHKKASTLARKVQREGNFGNPTMTEQRGTHAVGQSRDLHHDHAESYHEITAQTGLSPEQHDANLSAEQERAQQAIRANFAHKPKLSPNPVDHGWSKGPEDGASTNKEAHAAKNSQTGRTVMYNSQPVRVGPMLGQPATGKQESSYQVYHADTGEHLGSASGTVLAQQNSIVRP